MILKLLIFVLSLLSINTAWSIKNPNLANSQEGDSKLQDNATRKLHRVERTAVNPYPLFNNNENNDNNDSNDNNDNATRNLKRREAVNPYHYCATCRGRTADKKSNVGKSNTLGRLARNYHNHSLFSLIQL